MKIIIKKLFDNPLLSLYVISVVAIIIFAAYLLSYFGLYLYLEHWSPIYNFYDSSLEIQEKKEIPDPSKILELHAFFGQFARNFGWLIWMGISLFGLFLTLILTIWGRYTQEKQWKTQKNQWETQHNSHLHDRYEKAANMLGSEIMAVRVAGCQALSSLGKDDERMKVQCVRLLFSFIRNPYLDDEDKKKIPHEDEFEDEYEYEDEKFDNLFPHYRILRDDIQEAANSFSAIYNEYEAEGIDNEEVKLPRYFLKNMRKNSISLIKANLNFLNLEKAHLSSANLQGASLLCSHMKGTSLYRANMQGAKLLSVNLQEANLNEANMREVKLNNSKIQESNLNNAILINADISGTDMQTAKGLTKEQVLSTTWGHYSSIFIGGSPKLPKELLDDPDVKEWLAKPHFDKSKEKVSFL